MLLIYPLPKPPWLLMPLLLLLLLLEWMVRLDCGTFESTVSAWYFEEEGRLLAIFSLSVFLLAVPWELRDLVFALWRRSAVKSPGMVRSDGSHWTRKETKRLVVVVVECQGKSY